MKKVSFIIALLCTVLGITATVQTAKERHSLRNDISETVLPALSSKSMLKAPAYAETDEWKPLGKALYFDDCVASLFDGVEPVEYEVDIEESVSKPGVYRLVNPYGEAYPYNEPGDWDESKDYYMVIDASNPNRVYIPFTETGMDWGYGMTGITSYAYALYENGYSFDQIEEAGGYFGTLEEGVITFPQNKLLINLADYKEGAFFLANRQSMFRVTLPKSASDENAISGLTDVNGAPVVAGKPYALAVLTGEGKVFLVDAGRSDAAGYRSLSKAVTDNVNEIATTQIFRGGSGKEDIAEGDSYEWYLELDENGELLIKSGVDNYIVRLMNNQNAYSGGNVRANEPDVTKATPFQYAAVNTNTYSLKFNHATHTSEGYLGVGGGNFFGISSTPQEFVFISLDEEEEIVDGPVTLDELTSGWYQLENTASGWTPEAVGEYFGAVELADAVLHSGNWYDIVKVEDKTALSSLLYIDRVDDNHITVTLPTGYRMGLGCSRTDGANNVIAVDAPDEDQTNLRFKNSRGNNYWAAFDKDGRMVLGAGANQDMSRYRLHTTANMVRGKEVYTVVYGEGLTTAPTVTYNNEAYTGIKTVLSGGVYFIEKGAALSEADFTCAAGTAVEIDAQAKTITIVRGVSQEDVDAALAVAKEAIELRGVGYPSVESEAYSNLEAAIEAVEASEPDAVKLAALETALAAYKETTEIEQPEVGKSYRFALVSGNTATLKQQIGYLTYDEAGTKILAGAPTKDAVLQCVEEVEGKFVFKFAESGKYFIYKNGRAANELSKGAGENENKGYADSYEACYAAFELAHIAKSQYAVQDDRFGLVSMTVDVRNLTVDKTAGNKGCLTFKDGSGDWDTANGPFFRDSHTSAFVVEEVIDFGEPLYSMTGAAAEPNEMVREMLDLDEFDVKQLAEGDDIQADVYEGFFIIRNFMKSGLDLQCWYQEDEEENQILVYNYAVVGQKKTKTPDNISGHGINLNGEWYDLQMGLASFKKPGFLFILVNKLSDMDNYYYYNVSWSKVTQLAPLYRFVSANASFAEKQGVEKAMYSTKVGAGWTSLDAAAENQIWYFAEDEEGHIFPINYATGLFFNSANTQSANVAMTGMPHFVTLTALEAEGEQQYTIKVNGEGYDLHTGGHGGGAGVSGNIVGWNGGAGSSSAWFVRQLTTDEATEDMLAAAEAANEKLAAAYLKAEYDALVAAAANKIDELKATEGYIPVPGEKLITDAAQISSPKTEPSEGSIAALIDGNKGTFWHSQWSAGSAASDNSLHYLEFDLGQAYDNLMLTYQRRQGVANDHPTEFTITGSNDGENFEDIKVIPVTKDGDAVVHELFIGNETAYRYIRVRASMTDNWRGYWHAAEMNLSSCELVPGAHLYTKAGSKAADVNAIVENPAENPTQEDIDDLTEKLEALNNLFEAYEECKAKVATVNTYMLYTPLANDEEYAALTAALDALDVDALESILASLEVVELEDKAVFTLTSARGVLFAAENEEGKMIAVTSANQLGLTKAEGADQWAFIEYFGEHYLYNVANNLFLNPDLTLTEVPAAKENVFEVKNSSNAEYPFVIENGENWINVSAGYDEGVVINDWTNEDAGNQFAIRRVAFHNPAQAQYVLMRAFPPVLGDFVATPADNSELTSLDKVRVMFNDWTAAYEMSAVLRNAEGEILDICTVAPIEGVANGYDIVLAEPISEVGTYTLTVDAFLINEKNGMARWATVDLTYDIIDWQLVTTGDYNYMDLLFSGDDPGLELYQNARTPNQYKITHWGMDVDFYFTWDKETNEVKVLNNEIGYKHPTYGTVYVVEADDWAAANNRNWNSTPSYYDPYTKIFHFGVTYVVEAGSFGYGYETFVLEGGGEPELLYTVKGESLNLEDWDAYGYDAPLAGKRNIDVEVYEGGKVVIKDFAGVHGYDLTAYQGANGEVAFYAYHEDGWFKTGKDDVVKIYPAAGQGFSELDIDHEAKEGYLIFVMYTADAENNYSDGQQYYYISWPQEDNGEADYSTNYDYATTTRADRCTSSVGITTEEGETFTVEDLQTGATGEKIYWDRTDYVITVQAGETLYPEIGYNAQWMHGYVYVDEGCDGFSCDVDEETHGYLEGSDLKSWTYLGGYNSLGEEVAGNCSINSLPEFKAPAVGGTYRMRFKIDWDCADPKGQKGATNNLDANGGIIVDVTLVVEGGATGLFDNNKAYTLRVDRGYLPKSAGGSEDIVGVPNAEDAGHFNLIFDAASETYYIYSINNQMYLKNVATQGSFDYYTEDKEAAGTFTITPIEDSDRFIIASAANTNYVQLGGSKQLVIYDASWKLLDAGNQWAIEEVTDEAFAPEATGINDFEGEGQSIDAYNLQGIKMNNINKAGIYIVNRKKVVIKK